MKKGFGCNMFCTRVWWYLLLFIISSKLEVVNLNFLSFFQAFESAWAVVLLSISFSLHLSTVRCSSSFFFFFQFTNFIWALKFSYIIGSCEKSEQIGVSSLAPILGIEFISQNTWKVASVKNSWYVASIRSWLKSAKIRNKCMEVRTNPYISL